VHLHVGSRELERDYNDAAQGECDSRASVLERFLTAQTGLVLETATCRQTEEKHAKRHDKIDAMKWRLTQSTVGLVTNHQRPLPAQRQTVLLFCE